jgi:hypothetical protein
LRLSATIHGAGGNEFGEAMIGDDDILCALKCYFSSNVSVFHFDKISANRKLMGRPKMQN